MQRFESQKLAKSNKVRAKRPKEKRAGINAAARVSRTPRQSNGDLSRTGKKKKSRWGVPEDAKVEGAQLVRGHAPCEGRSDVVSHLRADLVGLATSSEATTNAGTFALSSG